MNPYEDFDDEDFDDGGFDDEYFDDEDLEHEMSPAEDNDEKPEIIQTKEEDRKDYDHLTEEEQVAIALQESLNIESRAAPTPPQSPPPSGSSSSKPEIIQTEEEDRKGKKVMEEEQVAIALQEILNIKSRAAPTPPQSPPPSGSSSSKPEIIQTEEEDRKGKKVMDYDYEQLREDEELARALQESLNIESRAAPTPPRSPPPSGSSSSKPEIIQTKEEDHNGKKLIDYDYDQLREDEELARALQESLNIESRAAPTPSSHWFDHISTPPQYLPPIGSSSQRYDRISTPPQYLPPIGSSSQRRTCAKCGWDIGQGCQVCHKSICDFEIPKDADGMIEGRSHKLCPLHEHELTPMCCSCERMEPRDAKYTDLNDGRKICGDCFDISIMDTYACQPLYIEIQEFYEELKIKAKHQIPLLMVQMQALNEAVQGEITVKELTCLMID
ncbi:hypothetical protein RND81_11G196700 [Saponaria officinalis]|uniref:Uncharacterized protein n=1 Tax=Saponaria officinalis TaxID=3572 RepID=A0AAW1HP36_SAPOF